MSGSGGSGWEDSTRGDRGRGEPARGDRGRGESSRGDRGREGSASGNRVQEQRGREDSTGGARVQERRVREQGGSRDPSSGEYGFLAEFGTVSALLAAVGQLRDGGYTRLEIYTPFAVDGMTEALGAPRDRVPLAMLLGGIVGGCGTLALQYYAAVIDYPINVGGRPDASWPAFIPAALEMTLLFAAVAGVVAMLIGSGLPRLNHPLFDVERFGAASRDGFFLVVLADDPRYEPELVRERLGRMDALHVERVAA